MNRTIIYSILVATSLLISTFLTVIMQDQGWLVLSGPITFAATLVGLGIVDSFISSKKPKILYASMIVGLSVLLATCIVAYRDPLEVKNILPLLASSSAFLVVCNLDNKRNRCCASK